MTIVKLKALEAFEDQDGKFEADEEFLVNDERAMVLTQTGKAERCADQTIEAPKVEESETMAPNDEVGASIDPPQFGVPRQNE